MPFKGSEYTDFCSSLSSCLLSSIPQDNEPEMQDFFEQLYSTLKDSTVWIQTVALAVVVQDTTQIR